MKWNKLLRFRFFMIIIFAITLLNPTITLAQGIPEWVRVVDATANGNDDGTTWDDAFNFLKDAIDEANAPQSTTTDIWIAEGTYVPDEDAANPTGTDDRSLSFMPRNGLSLYGAFPAGGGDGSYTARNPLVYVTILSGDIGVIDYSPDNSYHVVRTADVNVAETLFNGFVIRDGRALETEGIDGKGAGALVARPAAFVNCTFTINRAPWGGGGIYTDAGADIDVKNCIFDGNWSPDLGQQTAGLGGGIMVDASAGLVSAEIDNCLFVENNGTFRGGGLYGTSGANIKITNCTFARNITVQQGSAIFKDYSLGSIQHCIFWENTGNFGFDRQIDGGCTAVRIDRSSIQGELAACQVGDYNLFDEDPEFADPDNFDYRLLGTSPLIDSEYTDNDLVECDAFDVDDDGITCDENDPEFYEPTPDLDFNDRIVAADYTCSGAIVDMGAYEFPGLCCPWDMNDDGAVGTSDLLALLSAWGTDPDGPPDFDCSGEVGTSDLLVLLSNWGPCPGECPLSTTPLTIEEEMDDACLTMDDWDEYYELMQSSANQATKDRFQCWMEHYIYDCNKCTCTGTSLCPNPDPFDD